jgi:hypothetical protein
MDVIVVDEHKTVEKELERAKVGTWNRISTGSPAGLCPLPPFQGQVLNRALRQKLKRMAKKARAKFGKEKLAAVGEALLDQEVIDAESD